MARIADGGGRKRRKPYTPPKVPTTYDVRAIQSTPTRTREAEVTTRAGARTPTYDVQAIQSTPSVPKTVAPAVPKTTYDVQSIQSISPQPAPAPAPVAPAPTYDVQRTQSLAPTAPTYDVQSIQRQGAPTQQPSGATPTEQAAAAGGGVPPQIDPYFADLSSGMQYLYSQWPQNVGGVGTPTELAAGGGYGPSSYQWSESPSSLSELAQGRTPVGPALAAATAVETFLTNFGVRPEFVTSFAAQSLGLTPSDMMSMGYVQDLYARWIALDFGEEELVGGSGATAGGFYDSAGGRGGGGLGRYSSPAGFRSGYTSGLISWRIGF